MIYFKEVFRNFLLKLKNLLLFFSIIKNLMISFFRKNKY